MKQATPKPAGPFASSLDNKVACSVCSEVLRGGDIVRDIFIYKCGELDSIEILHDACSGLL